MNELQLRRDALADRVIGGVLAAFQKLSEYREEIEQLWVEFDSLKAGETIKGCATKTEFAEVHLRRNIRSVQYMLKGGNQNRASRPTAKIVVRDEREKVSRPAAEITLPPLTGDNRRDNEVRQEIAHALGYGYPYYEAGKPIIPFLVYHDPVLEALINEQARVMSLSGHGLFKDMEEEFRETGCKAAYLEGVIENYICGSYQRNRQDEEEDTDSDW